MKTKACKYCCSEIPKKAKVCPVCGRKQKSHKFRKLVFLIIVIAIVYNIATGNIDLSNVIKSTQDSDTKVSQPVNTETPRKGNSLSATATPKPTASASSTTTAKQTAAPTATATKKPTPTPTIFTGVRPEVKDAIDSCESFFNEFCDFMEKYENSNNAFSMAIDYAKFIAKYAEYSDKWEHIQEDDWNDAENDYFIKAEIRINNRLMKTAYSLN